MLPYLYGAALWHARRAGGLASVGGRVAFRSPSGAALTVAQIGGRHEEQEILMSAARSPMTDALERAGYTVIDVAAGGALVQVLGLLAGRSTRLHDVQTRYAMPLPLRPDEEGRWAPLGRAVAGLLEDWGAKLSAVTLAHFDYAGSSIGGLLAITRGSLRELTPRDEIGQLGTGMFSRRRVLVVNVDHPAVSPLLAVAAAEPEFAAYSLVKSFFVGTRLDPEVDGRLLDCAARRRWSTKSAI